MSLYRNLNINRPQRSSLILLLVLLGVAMPITACGSGLSQSTAAELIPNNKFFSTVRKEQFITGQIDYSIDEMKTMPAWKVYPALQSLGYIDVQPNANGSAYFVTLTEKGQSEAASWDSAPGSFGATRYSIPVAKREIIEVTGISEGNEKSATATFTWRWKSINDIGNAMGLENQTEKGTAYFQKSDDGWRVGTVAVSGNAG